MIDTSENEERVILVAVRLSDHDNTEESLKELAELADTAGAVCVAQVIQNRDRVHPGTYIGKGKIEELRQMIYEHEATGVICDDELSPAQMTNLGDELDVKVMDRTLVILDIFASRARTNEGRVQVELAQLKYRASRLTGLGRSLSRLGGGIGTKGPGETKLEMDRRLIHDRIAQLRSELEEVVTHRELTRTQRSRTGIPVISIVGYTNAGKSTLLNTLTDAGVLEEDKLFATLDPITRNLELESGQQVLLTDTVGFISKLPHQLVEAFKSTLEEAVYSDIILHVADASSPQMDTQMHVVYETLEQLGAMNKPIITAFNKQDRVENEVMLKDFKADRTVVISARTGEGLDSLKQIIEDVLKSTRIYIEKTYSYNDAGVIAQIRKYGQLISEEYTAEGIAVKAYVPVEIYDRVNVEEAL